MATDYIETTRRATRCPYCGSEKIGKWGRQAGNQRWRCGSCERTFLDTGALGGHRVPAEHIGHAIRLYYMGMSYKQIAEAMADAYDIPEPSKATIYEWVRDYTDVAVAELSKVKVPAGDTWVADEMQVKVGGKKAWLWNVMDSETRYILASHLSRERDGAAAKAVLRKALANAEEPPKNFFSDKLQSYKPALRAVLPKAKHLQSQGFAADINNNLSERLQGTYRSRTKTLRGLDSMESGQRYLDGWTLTYNLFREHESLRDKTPGERARFDAPYNEWADVVRASRSAPLSVGNNPNPKVVLNPAAKATAVPKTPKPKTPRPRMTPPPRRKQPAARKQPATPSPYPSGQGRRR